MHQVERDNEDEPAETEDLEGKSLSLGEIRELQAHTTTLLKRSLQDKSGLPSVKER